MNTVPTKHWCVSCDIQLDERTKKNTCNYCDQQMKDFWNSKRITEKDLKNVWMPRSYSDL